MSLIKLNSEQLKDLGLLNAKAALAKREHDHEQEKLNTYVVAVLKANSINTFTAVKITEEGLEFETSEPQIPIE